MNSLYRPTVGLLARPISETQGESRAVGARPSALIGAWLRAPVAGPALALAAPDADTILRKAYDNYRSQSSESTVAMTIHRPAWERHLELKAWTRGEDYALVRFAAPPKAAGR